MKRNAVLASLAALLFAVSAHAVTYDVTLLFDTDHHASTGCTFTTSAGTFAGAEAKVTTHVNVTGGTATTTGVILQGCVGGTLFGDPAPIDTHSWPAGLTSSGNLFIETHVAPANLGLTIVSPMRMAAFVTNGTLNDAVLTTPQGATLMFPEPGRRRAVNPAASPRTITLDGADGDWSGISPLTGGGGGSADLRILNVYGLLQSSDLFFAVRLQANHNAPTAVADSYSLPTVGGTLSVPAATGVLANDSDPNSLPLSAILVAGVQHGTLSLNGNGSFDYTNDGSAAPVDTFEYKDSNGTLQSNTAQVQIGIGTSGPNPPPTPAFTSADHTTFTAGTFGSFTVVTTPAHPTASITATGPLPNGVTFHDNGDGTATISGTPSPGTGGVYQLGLKATNVVGSATQDFHLTVIETSTSPAVTVQPASQTVCNGGTATFTAAASGTPTPSVQWQVSTNGGGTFSDIPGANSGTLTFIANASQNANQYRARFTNVAGTATTNAAILTVTSPPVVTTNPLTQTICAGSSVTFTAASTPSAPVQWQVSTGGPFTDIPGATSTSLTFVTTAADNGKQYRAVFTNACGTATTTSASLTVNVAPAVTSHPANVTVCAGATASFTVAGSGTPAPTVQWQVNSGSGFNDIPGATSLTLSFSTVAADNGKQYRAVLTNSCGTATSNAATLTVNTAPAVTTNPLTQIVCAGASVSFTAAASASPAATVQWQVDTGSGFNNIPGATATTLTFTALAGQSGNQYRAVFTNTCGTATTTAATLTVNVAPIVTTNPLPQTVCAGGTATFTAAASGTPAPTVQWQVDSGSGFNDIPGATSGTLSFATAAADNGKQYRAVFTNSCGTATSTAAALRVDTLPVVSTDPSTQTLCAGSPVTFTAAASSNAGQTVQWQVDTGSGFNDIAGETNTSLTFITAAADNGNQYRAVFTNSCGSVNTAAATLVIDTLPVVTTDPVDTAVCNGSPVNFTAAATSNAGDQTVQWQVDSGSGFTDIPGATSTTLTFTPVLADSGKKYRAVFTDACGSTNSAAGTLTVNTAPVVSLQPLPQIVCAGGTATFTAASSGPLSPTVQWQVSNGGPFVDIPGATSTTLSFSPVAGDNGKQYRAVFTNTCGSTNTSAVALTVDTLPVVTTNPLTQTICAGSSVTFTAAATSNASDHTVQWQVNTGSGFTDIPGATSTTLTFTTTTGQTGNQYRAVFTDVCGSTNTSAATLTVDTLPVVTTNPVNQTVCAAGTATFTAAATSNANDQTVQWQVSNGGPFVDIPGATSTTLSFSPVAGDNNKQYRAVFTTVCGSANTTAATLTVDTLPVVTVNPATQTLCAGATATFTAAATSNASDHTVKWQVSTGGPFTDIPGATSTTLSFTATAADNGKQYRAVFTDACGSANSSAATLTVDTLPVVTTDPVNQTVCTGTTATFTAAATSNANDHTVKWQVSNGGPFVDIPGATTTTLSFTATVADNGKQYRAVFTDVCGSTNTAAATLTVTTPPSVTANPSNTTVCETTTATFTAAATGNPSPTVQWQVDTGSGFNDIPGATSTTLSFTATAGQNGNKYRAVFTNVCGNATTTQATLTVNTTPVVTTHPLTQSVPAGNSVTFTAAASGTPAPTVQWQVNTGSGFTDIVGATNTSLTFTAQLAQSGNQYRAVFTNACGTANSNAATLTVTCPIIVPARTGGGSFPAAVFNTAYSGQSFTASGGAGPYTFAVTGGTFPPGLNLAGNGTISGTPTATGTFNFTVTATDTPSNCTGSAGFSIAVNPLASGDTYNNLVNNTQAVVTGGATASPVTPFVVLTGTITANDLPSGGVSLVAGTFGTTQTGSVTTAADGTFIYTPPVTATALASDTFTYTISSDTGGTGTPTLATGTVTLNLAGRVWYVNNSGPNGNGQSQAPFNSTSNFTNGARATPDKPSDIIFIHTGTGNTTNLTSGVVLLANEQLIGQGVALIVNTNTLVTAGTKPQITNSTAASDAVTLNDGNTVKGLTITGATRDGIAGATHAGFTGDTLTIQNNAAAGLHLTSMTGTVAVTNATISGNGTGLDVNNGTAVITLDNTNSITANAGQRSVSIQNRPAAAGAITIGAGITDNGTGILVNNNASGTIAFTGTQTMGTTTNSAVTLTTNTGTTITFSGTLAITTTSGTGFSASGGGTLNVLGTANITTGGATNGLSLNGITVGGSGVAFNTVTTTTATTGIALTNVTGTVSVNGGTITNGTTGISLQGASTNLSLAGITITGPTTAITNTTNFGTLTIGSSVNVSGVTALSLIGGNLNGTFANLSSTGGTNGVLLTSIGGTGWTATTGTLAGSTGAAFKVDGGNANMTYGGSITSTGFLVDIGQTTGRSGGTITFSTGTLGGVAASAGTGIRIQNSTGTSTFTFSGTQTLGTTGSRMASTAVTLAGNNTTTTFNFSGTLSIATTGVTAFTASGPTGGTINFSGGDSIDAATGSALVLSGVNLGAGTLSNVTSTGGVNGISLTTVTGGALTISAGALSGATGATFNVSAGTVSVSDAGTITQATAGQAAVSVTGNHTTGTLTFTGAVTATNGTGLQFDNADGTYNFNSASNALSGGARVDILNNSGGTFSFVAGMTITNPGVTAFNVSASAPTVTYSGSISTNNSRPVSVSNAAAAGCGSITFQTGNITATAGSNGIIVNNCNAGTITFNNPAISLTTSTNAGVTLTGNSGTALVDFSPAAGAGLDVLTTTGKAFTATGAGSVKVTGTGNTLSTNTAGTGNTVLEVDGVTIASGGLHFVSLSGNGNSSITRGVYIHSAGGNGLFVSGVAAAGSGGTLQNYTQKGVFIDTANNINLSFMNLTGNGTANLAAAGTCGDDANGTNTNCAAGIDLQTVSTVNLTSVTVTDGVQIGINGKNVSGLTFNSVTVSSVGDEALEDGVQLTELTGTNSFTSVNFNNNASRQLAVQNSTGTGTLNITTSSFTNTAYPTLVTNPASTTAAQGILFSGHGNANMTINIQNSTFTKNFGAAVFSDTQATAVMNFTVNGGTISGNGLAIQVGGVGSGAFNYTLSNATISVDSNAVTGPISFFRGSGATGNWTGSVTGNTLGTVGVPFSGSPCTSCVGMIFENAGTLSGSHNVTISGNTIRETGHTAIHVATSTNTFDDAGIMNVKILNNTISDPSQAGDSAIMVLAGDSVSGDTSTVCADVSGNVITNGTNAWNPAAFIAMNERFITTLRLPGFAGGTGAAAAVFVKGQNGGVATVVADGNDNFIGGGAACF
jgi:hypothetical protein